MTIIQAKLLIFTHDFIQFHNYVDKLSSSHKKINMLFFLITTYTSLIIFRINQSKTKVIFC